MSSCETSFGRLKLGEIFHNENNDYEFTCDHCMYDFKQFAEFAAHVQEYLEELVFHQRPIVVETDSDDEKPYESAIDIDDDSNQQLMTDEMPIEFENDVQESHDNDESDVELIVGSSVDGEDEISVENVMDDDVIYVIIGDIDVDKKGLEENNVNNIDAVENDNETLDDDYVNNDIENEPDEDRTNMPMDGGYKCPLCADCYSTIEFLQMHLSNYHSKSTIYNYLTVATTTTNQTNKVTNHIKLSKRIEDLPAENILLENSLEATDYSKYLFGFRFEKTSSGLNKCPECKYTGVMFKVKNHVFTHTKKKLFTCIICKQKFHTLARIRRHMRKVHLCV